MNLHAALTSPVVLGRLPRRLLDGLMSRRWRLPAASGRYTVTRAVPIPLRDGVCLAADLYRPVGASVGTLLVRTPYGRDLMDALRCARPFAARGYTVLFVSCRGTADSGGTFDPTRTEAADGHDVVAWMREQPWYTGSFATHGTSYLGFTQWALLADPPPDLRAAVIGLAPHDFASFVWGTGSFRLDYLAWAAQLAADRHPELRGDLTPEAVDAARAELPLAEAGQRLLRGGAHWYREWVTRPDLDNPFWTPTRHGSALDRADVPVLLVGGWYDVVADQTVEQYRRLAAAGADVALTMGAWSHGGTTLPPPGLVVGETLGWLDQHLARRAGRRAAPVRVFVGGAQEWRELPAWPPATVAGSWYLHPDGGLAPDRPGEDAPPSRFRFDPADPTPSVGGAFLAADGVVEDSALAARDDVLSFTTAQPLAAPLEIAGAPVVELAHTSDNRHVDLLVRLSEVAADGRSHNVAEGYRRLDPARGDGSVRLPLADVAHRFAAGSRLRVLVAGGSFPLFARNLGTGDDPGTGSRLAPAVHTIGHGGQAGSRLVLPVLDSGRAVSELAGAES